MGIAGMILGIIGVVFAFIPLVGPFMAIPCIAVGLPLSIVGFVRNRRRNQGKGMAIAGIACTSVALLMTIISIALTASAVSELDDVMRPDAGLISGATEEELTHVCAVLADVGYDYWSLNAAFLSGRTMEIAADIHTSHPGPVNTMTFCTSR